MHGPARWSPACTLHLCLRVYLAHVRGGFCAKQVSVLDAGCGEGMYLARVQAALQGAGKQCEAFGIDVSKMAIRLAAKRHTEASFAVASSYILPFDNQARCSPFQQAADPALQQRKPHTSVMVLHCNMVQISQRP